MAAIGAGVGDGVPRLEWVISGAMSQQMRLSPALNTRNGGGRVHTTSLRLPAASHGQ